MSLLEDSAHALCDAGVLQLIPHSYCSHTDIESPQAEALIIRNCNKDCFQKGSHTDIESPQAEALIIQNCNKDCFQKGSHTDIESPQAEALIIQNCNKDCFQKGQKSQAGLLREQSRPGT